MLDDTLLAAAAVVELLAVEADDELDCAVAELEEDAALVDDEDEVTTEALVLDVLATEG